MFTNGHISFDIIRILTVFKIQAQNSIQMFVKLFPYRNYTVIKFYYITVVYLVIVLQ